MAARRGPPLPWGRTLPPFGFPFLVILVLGIGSSAGSRCFFDAGAGYRAAAVLSSGGGGVVRHDALGVVRRGDGVRHGIHLVGRHDPWF